MRFSIETREWGIRWAIGALPLLGRLSSACGSGGATGSCSHQITCLYYAVFLLGCILIVGGKPWYVNVVHQVQSEGGFTTDNQEKWGVASDCLNTAIVGQTH